MNPIIRLAAVVAGIVSVTAVASAATTYDCTPKAIAAKYAYTSSAASDFVSGKFGPGKRDLSATLTKVWDGKGDCDPNGNQYGKLDAPTQASLMATHYYGDMMTVSVLMQRKDYKDARTYMDDFMTVHQVISGPLKAGFNPDFWAQDGGANGVYAAMKSFNAEITKAGYKPTQ